MIRKGYKCGLHGGCSDDHSIGEFEPTLTQQHFAEECDINEILKRVARGADVPVNGGAPVYGDFTVVPQSLTGAFAMIKQANDLFAALPWQARERFGNDPQKMIEFLNDPQNREEGVKLGLVKAVAAAATSGAVAASPTPGGAVSGAAQ